MSDPLSVPCWVTCKAPIGKDCVILSGPNKGKPRGGLGYHVDRKALAEAMNAPLRAQYDLGHTQGLLDGENLLTPDVARLTALLEAKTSELTTYQAANPPGEYERGFASKRCKFETTPWVG